MKKRILQLIPSFHQGGSESQAVALTKALKADGSFDVYAATLNSEGVLRREIEDIGLPDIPEFRLTSFYGPGFVKQVGHFAKYLRRNEIDLIHTHDFYSNVFGMAAATVGFVKARVASKRETGGVRSAAQEFVERLAFSQARAIVSNSESVRRHLVDQGVSADKIRVIYNGIDLVRFNKVTNRITVFEEMGLPNDAAIQFVVIVANLRHEVKNIPMLLRAAAHLVRENAETHFVVAGEGELQEQLIGMARELGVAQHVHFIGRCSDVPALLSVAGVCVLTSTAEGFSNSILEYMAAGKPVVATDVGGASEAIIDGETGYLVEPNDDTALAARLRDLLNDGTKSASFGVKGRAVSHAKFSKETQLKKTLELYGSLLS